MKKLFLVVNIEKVDGKFARVETVSSSDNLKKYMDDKTVTSINAYAVEKHATEHAKTLNSLYIEQGVHLYR